MLSRWTRRCWGDLALEAAVLGRARYLKALAEAARRTDVRAMAERLQTAHSATVEWICRVLAEEAPGGPAALRAPPIQRETGGATRTISWPVRAARESVNHTMSSAREAGEWARKAFSEPRLRPPGSVRPLC
jgi:hypothetical protein